MEIKQTKTGIEIRLRLDMTEAPAALKTPFITAGIVAEKTGFTRKHVNKLAPRVPGAYQLESGIWIFPYTAINYIKTTKRPKTGRKKMRKIHVQMTHREAMEEVVHLIAKYTNPPHWPGTDHSWEIGINEHGEPDATCDAYLDRFNAMTIPVIFYDTTKSGSICLAATDEMSKEEVYEWYVEEFMEKEPDGFEQLEFLPNNEKGERR